MEQQRDKVIYIHRRGDDRKVFYVGMGTSERPFSKKKRNPHWKNTVKKHGYEIEVLMDGLTFEEACRFEILLIAKYRELNSDIMTNICDGGEGGPSLPGDKHPLFCGYQLLYSDDGKAFVICGDGHECGFIKTNVSKLKQGKRDYITSLKLHINGVKVRFTKIKVFNHPDREKCFDECANFIVEHNLDLMELCDDEIHGRSGGNSVLHGRNGVENSNFKGLYIGTHRTTGAIVICDGIKTMKEYGFNQSNMSACITGREKSHKNFTFTRTLDTYQLNNLLDTHRDMFLDYASEFRVRAHLDKWELQ